jgi:hypothetical protein
LNHALKSEVINGQKKEATDNPIRVVMMLFLLLLLLLLLRLLFSSVVVVASFFARLLFFLPSFACLFRSRASWFTSPLLPPPLSRRALLAVRWRSGGKIGLLPGPTALPLFTLFPASQCVLFLRVEEKTFW